MGQSQSSTQTHTPNELQNLRAECTYNSSAATKLPKRHTFNKNRASTKSEPIQSRSKRNSSGKGSIVRFRPNSSQKSVRSIFSNDVELIVRKKLITTTTTTTINPVDLDCTDVINAEIDLSKASCIDENNNQVSTMHREVNNANPENTADAVAALMKDYSKESNSIVVNSTSSTQISNEKKSKSLTNLPSLADGQPEANQRISTFKKEQLEYEFRIRPNDNKKKRSKLAKHSAFITVDSKSSEMKSSDNAENVIVYRRLYCCGIRCCQFPFHFPSNETDSPSITTDAKNTFSDSELEFEATSCTCCSHSTKKNRSDSVNERLLRYVQSIFCCFSFRNHKCCQALGKKFYFQNGESNSSVSKSSSNHLHESLKQNGNISVDNHLNSNRNTNSLKGRLRRISAKSKCSKKTHDNEEDDILAEEPPVTCIRVLRPSNDLTPVKFDSQYNIIQAYNSDSTSLIYNTDNTINEFDVKEY